MQGHWRNNFADGTGTLTYADGDKYVGHWKEGKKSDDGELYYTNGDKFRYVWIDLFCVMLSASRSVTVFGSSDCI